MENKGIGPNLFKKDICYYSGLVDNDTCQGRCDENGCLSKICKACIFCLVDREKIIK